jgi:hypothetical protein
MVDRKLIRYIRNYNKKANLLSGLMPKLKGAFVPTRNQCNAELVLEVTQPRVDDEQILFYPIFSRSSRLR